MVEKYGRLVRLWGIHPSQLPAADAKPQELKPFVSSVLLEAVPFIADLPPSASDSSSSSSPWKSKGSKTYSTSTAPVQIYERVVSPQDLQAVAQEYHLPRPQGEKLHPETWFLRRSVHEGAAATGTANWGEFVRSFKEDHANTEKEFTPTVLSTKLKQQWDCSDISVDVEDDTWEDLTLKLEESVHKLPAPLKNRVFPVVQVTASARGRREFIVVQIAARDPEAEAKTGGDIVRGAYTSVERVRETGENGDGRGRRGSGGSGNVEWVMGTVSDARGVLPGWMQKMAVPSQVAKDVDMFMGWIAKERKGKRDGGAADKERNGRRAEAEIGGDGHAAAGNRPGEV